MRLRPEHHQKIFFGGLLLTAVGLPLSPALMSIGQMVLLGNWLWEGDYAAKWTRFTTGKALWWFLGIYGLHILGLAWTQDFDLAFHDMRIKLPMLILPLVLGTSPPLPRNLFRLFEGGFIAAVVIGTLISTAVWLGWTSREVNDIRDISIFVSHIRFGLMIALAVLLLAYQIVNRPHSAGVKLGLAALAVWLLVFMVILEAFSGLVVLLAVAYIVLLRTAIRQSKPALRFGAAGMLIVVPLLLGGYLALQINAFFPGDEPPLPGHDEFTPRGELYHHAVESPNLENGRHVHWYIAKQELEDAWNQRSSQPISQTDEAGRHLRTTLLRFLTSKGEKKDQDAVLALTDEEVQAIESGVANVRFLDGNPFSNRIYMLIWELYSFSTGENPEGNSLTQRLEYWRAAWWLIEKQPFTGVGTGDLDIGYAEAFEAIDTPLSEQYRWRAHNQFLTMWVAFGVFGMLLFIAGLMMPGMLLKRMNDFRFMAMLILVVCSMLNEDTLETQAGATLVALFYCVFLWSQPRGVERAE